MSYIPSPLGHLVLIPKYKCQRVRHQEKLLPAMNQADKWRVTWLQQAGWLSATNTVMQADPYDEAGKLQTLAHATVSQLCSDQHRLSGYLPANSLAASTDCSGYLVTSQFQQGCSLLHLRFCLPSTRVRVLRILDLQIFLDPVFLFVCLSPGVLGFTGLPPR